MVDFLWMSLSGRMNDLDNAIKTKSTQSLFG